MEWLLILVGLVLVLAFFVKLKLFGNAPENRRTDDTPTAARKKAANLASVSGQMLHSATEAVQGVYEAAERIETQSKIWALEAKAEVTQAESVLGKSLNFRKTLLSNLLKQIKLELETKDILGCDPHDDPNFIINRERINQHLGIDSEEELRRRISSEIMAQLREIEFFCSSRWPSPPANLRLLSIPFLCHFTRLENLPSILEHGIVPVSRCKSLGINPIVNDKSRFDRRVHTSSFSIGHPNARMLYKYRQLDAKCDWVVLAVNVDAALSSDNLFCHHNAADVRISRLPDAELQMNRALQRMFESNLNSTGSTRFNEPTDDQAEILIPRIVPPSDIHGVFFLSEVGRTENMSDCGGRAVFGPGQSKVIFGRRRDASLGHTAGVIRKFDQQIDELEREFRKDQRLFDALDRRVTELTQVQGAGGILGLASKANERRWYT